jgi:hypothetical protein
MITNFNQFLLESFENNEISKVSKSIIKLLTKFRKDLSDNDYDNELGVLSEFAVVELFNAILRVSDNSQVSTKFKSFYNNYPTVGNIANKFTNITEQWIQLIVDIDILDLEDKTAIKYSKLLNNDLYNILTTFEIVAKNFEFDNMLNALKQIVKPAQILTDIEPIYSQTNSGSISDPIIVRDFVELENFTKFNQNNKCIYILSYSKSIDGLMNKKFINSGILDFKTIQKLSNSIVFDDLTIFDADNLEETEQHIQRLYKMNFESFLEILYKKKQPTIFYVKPYNNFVQDSIPNVFKDFLDKFKYIQYIQ